MIIQHSNFGAESILRFGVHEGKYDYGNHIHQFSEFVFVHEGELTMTVEGKTEIGKAGDVFLITPFKVNSFKTEEYCKILIFVFSNDFATDLIGEETLYRGRDSALFTPSDDVMQYVNKRLVDSAHQFEWKTNVDEGYRRVKCCVHILIDEYISKTQLGIAEKKTETLGSIFLYLSQHYRENISLDSVSRALGYTKGHISHCLEAIPNFNFNDLVNSLRVEYAKNIMLSANYRNIDVALESGFTCERSFHRAFKKFTSMTPGEYLKSKRQATSK